jgi:hypothetical protein
MPDLPLIPNRLVRRFGCGGSHTRLIIANRQRSTLGAEYRATMRGT